MNKILFEQNLRDKHSRNIAELFNTFDIQAIPEDLIKIFDSGFIEFIYISRRNNIMCKAAEICVVFPNINIYRRIYVLCDYSYCIKYREIPLREFNTCEGRNAEIKRLYEEEGLSQVFIGRFFKLCQPSISLILKKGRDSNNE